MEGEDGNREEREGWKERMEIEKRGRDGRKGNNKK